MLVPLPDNLGQEETPEAKIVDENEETKEKTEKVRMFKPKTPTYNLQRPKDPEVPTWTKEDLESLAHRVASEVVSDTSNLTPTMTFPIYRAPGRFSRRLPKSKNKLSKIPAQVQASAEAIAASQQAFRALAIEPVVALSQVATKTSTPESPLAFGDNYALKFRVLTAVLKEAGMDLPSTHLSEVQNVNDIVRVLATERDRIAQIPDKKTLAAERRANMPANIKFVHGNNKDPWQKKGKPPVIRKSPQEVARRKYFLRRRLFQLYKYSKYKDESGKPLKRLYSFGLREKAEMDALTKPTRS